MNSNAIPPTATSTVPLEGSSNKKILPESQNNKKVQEVAQPVLSSSRNIPLSQYKFPASFSKGEQTQKQPYDPEFGEVIESPSDKA